MRATVMHKAGDVRIETVPDAAIREPTDALIRVTRACICGSDLWPYNDGPNVAGQQMGHEAIGIVEAVGSEVADDPPRPGRGHAVRFLRRHLPVLRGRAADGLRPWRLLRQWRRGRRRPGRGAAHPAGRRHALPARRRRGRFADAVAADAGGRDGHRPPRRGDRPGRRRSQRRRGRRRRRRPVRGHRRAAARRRADHHHGPPPGPDRARPPIWRHRRGQRARRRGGGAGARADRRPRRPVGPRMRRLRGGDGDVDGHRPPGRRGRPRRRPPL